MAGQDGAISRRALLGVGAAGAAGAAISLVGCGDAAPAPDRAAASGLTGAAAKAIAAGGRVRQYWIQADSFQHNLVPTGADQMMGSTFKPSDSTYWALGFRAYSPSWTAPLAGNADIGPNTGIPGPVIRAEVGDTVMVHFRNNDTHYGWPHSVHTHGFRYAPQDDGAYLSIRPDAPGTSVAPGQTYTYTWTAAADSVGTWLYHDHAPAQGLTSSGPVMEFGAELGLFGIVAITDAQTSRVDREFALFFHDLYRTDIPDLSQDFDAFNGACYLGNTPTFTARVGDRVRWRVAALGREFHVFHIHGHRWRNDAGRLVDSEVLGPSTTLTVEYTEDNAGDWLYHCHVTDHMSGGMVGWYRVS
jgi:manganese oxidase